MTPSQAPRSMFAARRKRFAEAIGSGVAVFASPAPAVRSNDTEYDYRTDSDILYLSGFEEPETVLVIAPAREGGRTVLFVRPKDPARELWEGRRAGPEGAQRDYGVDAAFPIAELDEKLADMLGNAPALYYRLGRNRAFDDRLFRIFDTVRGRYKKGIHPPTRIVDPAEILHEQRLVKSPEEIALLRRAAEITGEAHTAAMRACRPGMGEWELEALIEFVFRRSGSPAPGYSSIVGSGENATVLHYATNQMRVGEGDLVLVDAGCEWGGYTADVTRTFPASGRFTAPQRTLYELVLDAQKAAIAEIRPGAPSDAFHKRAVRVLTEGMFRLGLLAGNIDEVIENEGYKRFYPHGTGHWLGLDVHDVGRYRTGDAVRTFEPGMVVTVEPGFYVQPDDAAAPAEFRGLGVRIEDDLLVTRDGTEILTSSAPKEVADLERVVGSGLGAAGSGIPALSPA